MRFFSPSGASLILLSILVTPDSGICQVIKEPRPGWNIAGVFEGGRSRHTLTLLSSGRVLLTGGFNDIAGSLDTTSLYNPMDDRWTSTGSLAIARDTHTATVLPTGEVLVVGGRTWPSTVLRSAEVYDPQTGSWQPAAQPGVARSIHTATLLPSGQVLVVGGFDTSALAEVELYDPLSDSWSLVAPLTTARRGHTATLLPTGHVLVIGGVGGAGNFLQNTEVFDPVSGTWSSTAPDPVARAYHTATLMTSGSVIVVGGDSSSGPLTSSQLYDPATDTWFALPDLSYARGYHTASLLPSGRIVVSGGYDGTEQVAMSEEYHPVNVIWYEASHQIAREWPAAAVLASGEVLLTGGYNGGEFGGHQASSELYDSYPYLTDESIPEAPTYREGGHTATVLTSGLMLVTGGLATSTTTTVATELYDPDSETWHPAATPLNHQRAYHSSSLLLTGDVLSVGGTDDTATLAGCELFDADSEIWTVTGAMLGDRKEHTATLLPTGEVLVAGGSSTTGGELGTAELYDPQTGTWRATGSLTAARTKHTATLLTSGLVLVTAGFSSASGNLSSTEVYDPATGLWTPAAPLLDHRRSHTASLLPTGRVLVAGGRGLSWELQSSELYDPILDVWAFTQPFEYRRQGHTSTVLSTGDVIIHGGLGDMGEVNQGEIYMRGAGLWLQDDFLNGSPGRSECRMLDGGVIFLGGTGNNPEVYYQELDANVLRPLVDSAPTTIRFGEPFTIVGSRLTGASEADGGLSTSSASNVPVVQLQSLENSYIVSLVAEPSADMFGDSLEGGLGCWTASGLWHLVTDTSCATPGYSSPFNAAYFGQDGTCNYDTGATATGELISWPISDLTVDSALSFDFFREVENAAGSNDVTRVDVSVVDSPGWTTVWERFSSDPSAATWITDETVPLASFAGETIQLRFSFDSVDADNNSFTGWLIDNIEIDGRSACSGWYGGMALEIDSLPATLNPGWHVLTVISAGVPSEPRVIMLECSIAITAQPADEPTVANGQAASFNVGTQGAQRFQWQKCTTGECFEEHWFDIDGATSSSYSTPPVSGADSGSKFRVIVSNGCTSETSDPATLTLADSSPPTAEVLHPSGGEYWILSDPDSPPNTQLITWSMSDDVRICQVDVSLWYSNDGGQAYACVNNCNPDGSGLPVTFGPGGACVSPGETTTSVQYVVPTSPPSGTSGSLYKVQVTVTDHAGLTTIPPVTSANPFYIVQPNPDSVNTLILANLDRMETVMGASVTQTATLATKLYELAGHPRVAGFVADLGGVTSLDSLYSAWDADPGDVSLANNVLFGTGGIHELLLDLFEIYSGVEHVVLVGDDRIIPFARMPDEAVLFPESNYPAGGDLTVDGTTVGRALAADRYLSDDPLAVLDDVSPASLDTDLFIPDLNVGRLVESHEEITTTIATFISQDGVLDLTTLDAVTGHKVLITGYDFLVDSARQVRSRWKAALGLSTPDSSLEPVDGSLVSSTWDLGSVQERRDALFAHLSGNSGDPYAVASLNGHATHYEEGVPGTSAHDIEGLETLKIFGDDDCGNLWAQPIDMPGAVLYSPGCHGGLPVPGTCATDAEHSLDLAQTLLGRGAQAYMANTGYGWGLVSGIGYGERLVEIFTEEMTSGGTVAVGEVFSRTKTRYVLESPRLDAYDMKSLMQWTLYGLPMYAVRTGIAPGAMSLFSGPAPKPWDLRAEQFLGEVRVLQDVAFPGEAALPPYLTRLEMHFDLTAPGVYTKRNASGEVIANMPGCPDPPPGEPEGCYYTLNGLVERGSGDTDIPIQPYLIFDSRMSGTSQHGVLWMGGEYSEETGWVPVIGELASNGGDGSNHGSAPRKMPSRPVGTTVVGGPDPENCRPSDLELNGLVVLTGEAVREQTSLTYDIERTYRGIDLEVFYFNNTYDGAGNCDRDGPLIGEGPFAGDYHEPVGGTLEWAVPVSDTAGTWRVLVVHTDNTVDGSGFGTWTPLELADDGSGTWRGSLALSPTDLLTYVVQAVDKHGNVTWLEYEATSPPASGVDLGVPLPVDVAIPEPEISVDDVSLSEGDSGTTSAVFVVSLSHASSHPITVDFSTTDGTANAGNDYTAVSDQLSFAAGITTQTISVPVLGDSDLENDETFFVNLSAATNATVADGQALGTIENDDGPPTISIDDVSLFEGDSGTSDALFTVSLSHSSTSTITVDCATADGTAIAGYDYTAVSIQLGFPPGVTTRTIVIPVVGDLDVEGTETFFVGLSESTNAMIVDSQGLGRIMNDDHIPIFSDDFESGDTSAWD